MSPSLVYYNWLIVRTLRRNITHSPFEIHQSFKRFVANVALIEEWLKLGVALFCRRKDSIQQLLLTTVSTSLVVMTTSRNWRTPKKTKVSNCWALKLNSEWAKAGREHMDELNLTEMSLLTDNRHRLCEELCKFAVDIRKIDKTSIHRGASS